MVSKMPDEEAGKLFKLIFEYTNDQNPDESKYGILVEVAFAQIKGILKKDLEKWKGTVKQNSENGKKSAEARKKKSTEVNEKERPLTTVTQPSTNPTDKDKDKEDTTYLETPLQDEKFYKPSEKEVIEFFNSKGYNEKQAKKFFTHYNARKWENQFGKPVEYWKVTAHDWFDDKFKKPQENPKYPDDRIVPYPEYQQRIKNAHSSYQIMYSASEGPFTEKMLREAGV